MADDIEALLGGYSAPGADTDTLARALRARRRLGEIYSLSGIDDVRRSGRQMRRGALATATRVGTLRENEQNRLDDEAQRKVSNEQWERNFEEQQRNSRLSRSIRAAAERRAEAEFNRPKMETFFDRNLGREVTLVSKGGRYYNPANGEELGIDQMQGLESMADYSRRNRADYWGSGGSGGGRGRAQYYAPKDTGLVVDGEKLFMQAGRHGQAPRYILGGRELSPGEVERLEEEGVIKQSVAEAAGDKTFAQQTAKERAKELPELRTKLRGVRRLKTGMTNMANALREGAKSGPVLSLLPNAAQRLVTGGEPAQAKFLGAIDRLALEDIGNYTFGSLSDAEANWLRDVQTIQGLDEDELLPILEHRIEGLRRYEEVVKYVEDAYQNNRPIDRGHIDNILFAGGYTYADPTTAPPPETEVPPAVTESPKFQSMAPDRQAALLERWATATPEQRELLMQAVGAP